MLEGTSLSTHTHQGQSCKPGTRSRCPGPSSILQSLAACVRSSLVGHSTYSGMNCTVPRLLQRSGLSRRVKLREIFVISKCCWGYTLQATMPSKINKGPEGKGLLKTVHLFQLLSLLENSKAKASLKAAQRAHCEEPASDSEHWNWRWHLSPPGHPSPTICSKWRQEVIAIRGAFSETSWLSDDSCPVAQTSLILLPNTFYSPRL